MATRILPAVTALALTAIAIAGCSASRYYPGQEPMAIINVNNEHAAMATLTVYLEPALGTAVRLGTVDLNSTRQFRIRRGQLAGTYRLWGRPLSGRGFYSPEFTLAEGDVLEWDLRMNQVFLVGSTGGDDVALITPGSRPVSFP